MKLQERLQELLAKATPGPWMAAAIPSSVVGWPVVRQGVGRSICSVSYLPKAADAKVYAESEANAELIALAPTMAAQLDLYEAALREAEQWASAYPVAVFPEPDLEAVKKALGAAGILYEMDRLHASWARHLLTGIETIARKALNSTDTGA